MTQEEEVLPPTHRFETRCRLCFADEDDERSGCRLFPGASHHPATGQHPAAKLIEMILECTSIQITLEEDYPAKVCEKCVETLDKFYQYRRRCLLNDQILRTERQAAATTSTTTTTTTGHKSDGSEESNHQRSQRSSSPPSCLVPAIRIKSEPAPLVERLDEGGGEEEQQEERTGEDQNVARQQNALETDGGPTEGGTSSILRSILLQTRDSTTSRSSPNTEPESPRQTPQPPPSVVGPGNARTSPLEVPADEARRDPPPEEDVKPSLLQQMLLQHGSPARSPSKAGPSYVATDGATHSPGSGGSLAGGSSSSSTSSLLKRMLLDGSGTASYTSAGELLPPSPLEGTSHRRTKHEPLSATGTPSPPVAPEDDVPAAETPLASQLRSILLQHRAAAMVRSESMSAIAHQQQQHGAKQQDLAASVFEKPEVSYIRSLKRRRMEYPCLLCGRSFAGRTKLVMHMRTHMMPPASASPLAGGPPASPGSAGAATTHAPASLLSPALANGGHGSAQGISDLEDTTAAASPLAAATATATRGRPSYNHSPAASAPPDDGGLAGGNEDEIDALERRSYACYICGADQNNLHQLKEHLLAAHQDRIRSRGRTRERQRASIGCEICHRQFRSQFAYGEHMRTHTGERPFPCDQCDKRFPRRFQLLGHLFNVHKQSWVADESKAKFAKK
uniref:Protein krueppel n=1 Tax=Anopheles atroparvus TaxID=41427 RepID=A0A182IUT0_ANOAO